MEAKRTEMQTDEKQEKQNPDYSDTYPRVILVIIHGFKNEMKHKQLRKVAKAIGIEIVIPSKQQDTADLGHKQRVELYQKLILKHKPQMIIGQSSGGNVISSLVADVNAWCGPTWMISARLVEKIYKSKYKDLPILFSHGSKDNLSYMKNLCESKFSRCKLIVFEGDHYAQDLFVNKNAIDNIKELITTCYALRLQKPKQLTNKLSLNEMMKERFAQST